MHIATFKSGEGSDVVVIHGWTHDHRAMQPIIDLLNKNFSVTAVDLPGCGESEWEDSLDSIDAVADTLLPHLPKNAIYIGWSWGGAVCQSLAGRYPDRVNQLILIGSVPKFIEALDWPGVPQPGFLTAFADSMVNEDTLKQFMLDYYDLEFNDQKGSPEHIRLSTMLEEHGLFIPLDIQKKGLAIIDAADLRETFSNIQCPIDFIIGSDDQSVPVDWEKIKALNPRAKVHFIEGAQHFPFWTHQKVFNRLLLSML